MREQEKKELSIFALGVSVEVLYRGLIRESVPELHFFLFLGGLWAVAWCGIVWRYEKKWVKNTGGQGGAWLLLFLWTGAELIRTVLVAGRLCEKQFFSGAFWGLLPLLLLFGGRMELAAFPKTAGVLCGLLFFGGLLCAVGLYGQFQWSRLFLEGQEMAAGEMDLQWLDIKWGDFILCPEYFLLPLLWKKSKKRMPSAKGLPIAAFGLEFALFFGRVLLLGRQDTHGYTGMDALQNWEMGVFSRMDSAFLLLWLSAAIVRLSFLSAALGSLWLQLRGAFGRKERKAGDKD